VSGLVSISSIGLNSVATGTKITLLFSRVAGVFVPTVRLLHRN
jgi:hypothetical protein